MSSEQNKAIIRRLFQELSADSAAALEQLVVSESPAPPAGDGAVHEE